MTQDYASRLQWDPYLQKAELLGGARAAGLGVRAWCVDKNGLGMETEYVSFQQPRVAAVKMTRGPWFLARFAGSWRFDEVALGRTRVAFRYNLEMRPRWLAWLLTPLVASLFAREMRRRLMALKAAAVG